MGLETGTYISDLVTTNPPSGDKKSQGDDHLRLIKSLLRTTFPNADRAFRFPNSVAKTANYTVLSTDQNKFIVGDTTSGSVTLTLPTLASTDDGWEIEVVKSVAANTLTIAGTINGETNLAITDRYQAVTLRWSGTAWYAVFGVRIISAIPTFTTLEVTGELNLSSTSHMKLPKGTTAQRPGTPVEGEFRYNSSLTLAEFYDGGAWRQPSIAQPIAGGFKGLVCQNNSVTPNTKIDIDADAVTVETSTGVAFRLRSINLTIDAGTTGANGLDSGGLANSTWYYGHVIYNPTTDTTAGLLSTSRTSPTLPSGYTALGVFTVARTDASAHFLRYLQRGRYWHYLVGDNPTDQLPYIASGAAGTYSSASPTLVAVSVASVAPTDLAYLLNLLVANSAFGAGTASVIVAPTTGFGGSSKGPAGSAGNSMLWIASTGPGTIAGSMMFDTGGNIAWASSANGGLVSCSGFELNI